MRPPATNPRRTPTGVRAALVAAAAVWIAIAVPALLYGGSWSDVLLAAFVCAFFLLPLFVAVFVPSRKRPPRATGLCRVCGYSRQGLRPKSVCPECGHLPDARR